KTAACAERPCPVGRRGRTAAGDPASVDPGEREPDPEIVWSSGRAHRGHLRSRLAPVCAARKHSRMRTFGRPPAAQGPNLQGEGAAWAALPADAKRGHRGDDDSLDGVAAPPTRAGRLARLARAP